MKRIDYRKRRRRNMIAKRVVVGLCLIGALVLILYNQQDVMKWLHLRNTNQVPVREDEPIIEQSEAAAKVQNQIQAAVPQVPETEPTEQVKEDSVPASTNASDQDAKETFITDKEIHGVYYSAAKVSNLDKVDVMIENMKGTNINAVVFDVKDDSGYITFEMNHDVASEIGAISSQIIGIEDIVKRFHENDIYVIGRIVAFRDPILAKKKIFYAVKKKNGKVFCDRAGDTWLDPYNLKNWDYLMKIAINAANVGFDEVQFDYVRFSTEAKEGVVKFRNKNEDYSKTDVIGDFVQYAVDTLHPYHIAVSADVFGTIINSKIDSEIVGQNYVEMSKYLDFICPMIYPSHYGDGCYNLEVPDLQPYRLIVGALTDSNESLNVIDSESHCAVVRPWLQDFTASWKKKYQKYGLKQVEEQINGVYDSGNTQWLLWNSSGRYSSLN